MWSSVSQILTAWLFTNCVISYGDDRFRGFWLAEDQSLPFPIDSEGRLYNARIIVWGVINPLLLLLLSGCRVQLQEHCHQTYHRTLQVHILIQGHLLHILSLDHQPAVLAALEASGCLDPLSSHPRPLVVLVNLSSHPLIPPWCLSYPQCLPWVSRQPTACRAGAGPPAETMSTLMTLHADSRNSRSANRLMFSSKLELLCCISKNDLFEAVLLHAKAATAFSAS